MKYRLSAHIVFTVVAFIALCAAGPVMARIPTLEERIEHSTLNPSNYAWKAETIRVYPMPEGTTPPSVCFRYDFNLTAAPCQATVSISPTPSVPYTFKVNGQVLAEPMPGKMGAIRILDLTDVLHKGHNVLTFRSEEKKRKYWVNLKLEGFVFCKDGTTVKLMTDDKWRGGWDLTENWDDPNTDPSDMKPVQVLKRKLVRCEGAQPPYYGHIQIKPEGMRCPIFDEEKPVELAVTLVNARGQPPSLKSSGVPGKSNSGQRMADEATALAFDIFDEQNRKTVGSGTVELKPKGKLDLVGTLKYGPLPTGAYRVRLTMTVGTNQVDRRDYEVVSVGVIKQREVEGKSYTDGMKLKEVWNIDCTAEPKPGDFIAMGPKGNEYKTVVKEGPAGKYREFVENRYYQNFAYKFKVKNLYVPHLAVIEWPDDAHRGILVQIYEASSMFTKNYKIARKKYLAGFQRGETAIVCTDDHPRLSNRMQKLYIIFWPNEEDASVHVWNTSGAKEPAAASRITIYEILNDLPALKINDAGDRMIGYHTELGPATMSAGYYAGPLGALFSYGLAGVNHPEMYRNWHTTTENMIKRMRFSGQNMYLMGHFMYTGVLYPTKRYIFAQNLYRGGDASADYISLMLRMFERNGMSMVSGIEYVNTADVLAESTATLEEVIKEGAPTLYCMRKDAKLSSLHGGCKWQGLNYFHPRVQESILTIVDELVDLYADYPAWKGIGFILSRNFGPMTICNASHDNALNYGYEDFTIELFQKDTRIRIPVRKKDPERFMKRYEWLMANKKQEWIDWRCRKYTELYCRIRDRVLKGRPDLKLYLMNFEPMNFTAEAMTLAGHMDDPEYMKEVVKQFGFDIDALKKEKGIVLSYSYPSPGTGCTVSSKHRVYYDQGRSQVWNDLFAGDGKGGAYIWSGIPHYGPRYPEGKWLFVLPQVRQGYFWPRYFSDTFVNVMVRSNPTWIPHTWMDVVDSGGRLHDLRLFSRAYRSLPNGKYTRLTGNGLDKNLWVEVTKTKGAIYGYAANAQWWDVDVVLEFKKGTRLHDLINDQPVTLKDGKWTFKLGPYEVNTFRIERGMFSGSRPIRGASVRIEQGPDKQINEALDEGREVVKRARAKEEDIRDTPGWRFVPELEKILTRIKGYRASDDLDQAGDLAWSWERQYFIQSIINESLEAMPFIVLGSFGEEKNTDQPPESYFEVVKEYKGLETPFIGEFEIDKGRGAVPNLRAGFKPDLSKTYKVYPDKKTEWQSAFKKKHMTFYGICNSPQPFWMVAYAYTEIFSPEDRDVVVYMGSDHAVAIWINDKLIVKHGGHGTHRGGQRPANPDQNKGTTRLTKGWNRVLVKAVERGVARVFFRLTDTEGKGLDDLKFRIPKES